MALAILVISYINTVAMIMNSHDHRMVFNLIFQLSSKSGCNLVHTADRLHQHRTGFTLVFGEYRAQSANTGFEQVTHFDHFFLHGLINEPAVFDPFLNTFGLDYGPNYNGVSGEFSIGTPHPLFVGVQSMYHNNGNNVSDLVPGDSRQSIILTKDGKGLIGVYVSNSCVGDINTDGVVDDTDFVIFAAAYNILDCADPAMPATCPADLNKDGFVDDTDFVIFAAAYNDLICP